MPFGVTAWPYFPDPRHPDFSLTGYAFGQVPPNKFIASTTGALSPYLDLNEGVLLEVDLDIEGLTRYSFEVFTYRLTKFGFKEPIPDPTPHTVQLTFVANRGTLTQHTGDRFDPWPDAIRPFAITMVPDEGVPQSLPNPVVFSPARFDEIAA